MKKRKVNWDYLNLYQEIPLFCALIVRNVFRKKAREANGRVLIVNTCLIGEFAASIPALRDYIERTMGMAVDLMVSPPLKPLAERIRGVHAVYAAKSLYGRSYELGEPVEQTFTTYDEIIVMRISRDAFRLVRTIQAGSIHTILREYSKYSAHLGWNVLGRRAPKQWREMNFEMLGGQAREMPFDDLFQFKESDYADVARLEELQTTAKKIIIHTGAGWVMKKWELDRWAELLQKINALGNVRFIFVGGGEDASDFATLASKLDFPIYSLIGKIDLLELLLVLRQSDYFIGTDSGPKNMAHLADTRSVSLFGPGPHFYLPWSAKDVAIDKSRGRGLLQMFFSTKHAFINDITVDEVFEAFKNRLWNS